MKNRLRGWGQEAARYNLVEILNRRYNGDSCKEIAADMGIPEHAIWQVCRETGLPLPKARPKQPRRTKVTFLELMNELSGYVDSIVFERSADETSWICYIDDIPGEQCLVVDNALRSALHAYDKYKARAS